MGQKLTMLIAAAIARVRDFPDDAFNELFFGA
jgi:hypothetical protein